MNSIQESFQAQRRLMADAKYAELSRELDRLREISLNYRRRGVPREHVEREDGIARALLVREQQLEALFAVQDGAQ